MSRFNSCAPLCSRGLTIATVFTRASRLLHSHLFSAFYMRPPVLWTTWRRPITWHRRWWISTGCLSSSASNTNCVVMFTTYPLVTPLCTYQICSLRVPTSHRFPGCGRRPAATTSSRGRGWSWVKGRSLYLPLSHGIIFRMISRSLNVLLLLNVSSKHFYSNRRILKTNYVMRLRSSSRKRTKSHRVMLCYVMHVLHVAI